jgi:hypothetical protein
MTNFSTSFRQYPGVWLAALAALCVLGMQPVISQAVEEPSYRVLQTLEDVEIRQYAGYTVAEVLVPPPAEDAGSRAFPILADYIFGKNKGERKMAMTAPVTQTAAPVKMDMTAPVTQTARADGILVQFVLPDGITPQTAPEPLNERVMLRAVASKRVAVIRYSGFWSEDNYNKHLSKLKESLRTAGIAWQGEPVFARYNGPMTPWFLRRNEIWLELP